MPESLHNSRFSDSFPEGRLEIDGCIVTYQPETDRVRNYFPGEKEREFQNLLERAQIDPKGVYPEALLFEKSVEPNPLLDNLLTYLHIRNGKKREAEALIAASYKKDPGYFFARINYADQCLRNGDLQTFSSLFPTLDLRTLLPGKTSYHVSEFRGFMLLSCRYFLAVKNKKEAERRFLSARSADPLHPGVLLLEKTFGKPGPLRKFFASLLKSIGVPFSGLCDPDVYKRLDST